MTSSRIYGLSKIAFALNAPVMALLFIAAASKLWDLAEFQRSLDTWSFVPPRVRPAAALLIPALELTVSLGWFLTARRHRFAIAATALLAVFTLAYLIHWFWIEKPTCNCFGIISQYLGDKENTSFFLVRNARVMTS